MATNQLNMSSRYLSLNVGVGKISGQPVAVGQLVGVVQNNADATTGVATIDRSGVYNLLVGGIDQGGNSAVAVGDQLYFVVANTPPVSKVNTGVPFGKALGAVVSGVLTTTIPVVLGGS